MYNFSPFLLVALMLALGLTACSEKPYTPPKKEPVKENPTPPPAPRLGDGAVFHNNADSTPLFTLLDSATASIDIEIYEMGDNDVLASLRRALERKVTIRVVKEPAPLGAKCDIFAATVTDASENCLSQRKLKEEIVAAGGAYVPFQKSELCADPAKNCFQHGKLVVVDGKTALVSTGNFNSSNLCNLRQNPDKCNRDFSMVTTDEETVALLAAVFQNDLKATRYDLAALLTPSLKEKVTVSPLSLPPTLALIQSAKTSLRLENQYLKDKDMNEALIAAARRGVKVEVTLASLCAFGPPSPREKESAARLFGPLEEAGISIRMLPTQLQIGGKPGYMHAKALVVDDAQAWVGSVNGSTTALTNNREFGLIFSGAASVAALVKVAQTDHTSLDVETWGESLECKKDTLVPNGGTRH